MAAFRLILSDGTTSIDLYGDRTQWIMEAGLSLPPPAVRDNYVSNPFQDGARLASSVYENRTITLAIKIKGNSLTELKTNIRAINRLLNDAEERTLLGHGSQVYLECQWGNVNNASTFFDVMRGDLAMSSDYLSRQLTQYYVDATITLVCLPLGRYTNQDIDQETIENSQSAYDLVDYYWAANDSDHEVYGLNWEAQTFAATGNYTAVGAAIKLYREGNLAGVTITLALYNTVGGVPSGAAIAVAAGIDVSAITNDTGLVADMITYAPWIRGIFATPVALTNGTVYALVCYLSVAGGVAQNIHWESDSAAGYAGGQRCWSNDGGTTWNADATDDNLFAIYQAEAFLNYQDITTSESYGDIPAKSYIRIAQTGAAGTEKVWVAKRSGARQTDDLWIEGEDFSSHTMVIAGTADYYSGQQHPLATASGELFGGAYQYVAGAGVPQTAPKDISRLNYTVTIVPVGQFRVLMRAKVLCDDAADYDHISFGFGWSYGDKTYTPTAAKGEFHECAAHNTWEILDLGILDLPPIPESEIADNNAFELRIFQHTEEDLTPGEVYNWDIDYIFLLPIDEGVVIISDIAAADVLGIDNISHPNNVFVLSAADLIEDYPDYVGKPFPLGRESTRIYFLRDDTKNVTFAVDTKYQPQFLVI